MNESEWVELIKTRIQESCLSHYDSIKVDSGVQLPYGYEILEYEDEEPIENTISYQTDLLIWETLSDKNWKPRLIIECKINSVTTHDSITYSQKAFSHKSVHPYLRYGIMLGNRKEYPLPGRLYRHGMFFDFMMSYKEFQPSESEMIKLTNVIHAEIEASRQLERIIYESRKKDRDKYTLLHRKLELGE